jgi:hypothetical protein
MTLCPFTPSGLVNEVVSDSDTVSKVQLRLIIFIKIFARQIYSFSFHISKLNDLKVIRDLYS